MLSAGVKNPQRNFLICIGVTVAALGSIAWGVLEMRATGGDSFSSGIKIGPAILFAILGPALAYNFWRGVKVFEALRRGDGVIARWTVTAAELAEFDIDNKARNARRGDEVNDWAPPHEAPASGVEFIFAKDGVLAGDTYFALVTTGLYRFTGVSILSGALPVIAFKTITTYANRFGFRRFNGELRLPVSRAALADAERLVTHFSNVGAGKIVVNSNFYRSRMRFGIIAAPIFFAIAGIGFAMKLFAGDAVGDDVSTIMIGAGLIFGIAMLILVIAAGLMGGAKTRRPG